MTVTVHHHLPGRTRLRLAPWPSATVFHEVSEGLARSGCLLESANPATGSLLVRHDRGLDAGRLCALVESHSARAAGEAAREPAMSQPDVVDEGDLAPFLCGNPRAVLDRLESSEAGLDDEEARRRLSAWGLNAMPAPDGRSRAEMAVEQFTTFPVALLFGSAILSVATGGLFDAAVTLSVVLINAGIGFSSENATEKLIRRLSRPIEHEVSVLRAGASIIIPAREVVPGDVILLSPGSFVAADARIIHAQELTVDESVLTGESLPVEKIMDRLDRLPASVAERYNMVHGGTVVTGGDGRAVVVRTGPRGEMARTRAMIGLARPPRPEIEDQLEHLSRRLAVGCLGASTLVLGIGLLRGEPVVGLVRSAIALAVAAIPEGLPAVATSTLALGARAMEKEKAYVRALAAIEALGTVDTICLDKTGTLTENRMRVVAAHVAGRTLDLAPGVQWEAGAADALRPLAEAATLCNEASLAQGTGSATERALLHLARLLGIDPDGLQGGSPILNLQSRNQSRHWMATSHRHGDADYLALKGAPDEVLALSSQELCDGVIRPLDAERRRHILAANEALAARGLRILGIARGAGFPETDLPDNLVWLGLVGLADPIRAEAAEAVELFHKAGIRTIMLTGDQPATALAVAETLSLSRTGIIPVVETSRFAGLDDRAVGELALKTSVFARVSPGDKLRIVRGLQAMGRRVAMIGDGVNDGPALRASAVGVAMGARGTDVAREVADIVIADDDLRTLAQAIARGRTTNDNIRMAIRYYLSTNFSEILVMLGEALHGRGTMETPMELFWLNLVTDILPGFGLALAEPGADVMTRPPRAAGAPLFDRQDILSMGADGGGIAAASLAAHFLAQMRGGTPQEVRSVTFMTLALSHFLYAWSLLDRVADGGEAGTVSEKRLVAALAGSGGLLGAPLVLPLLRRLLGIGLPTGGQVVLSGLLAGASYLFTGSRRLIPGNAGAAAPLRASRPDRTELRPAPPPAPARAG